MKKFIFFLLFKVFSIPAFSEVYSLKIQFTNISVLEFQNSKKFISKFDRSFLVHSHFTPSGLSMGYGTLSVVTEKDSLFEILYSLNQFIKDFYFEISGINKKQKQLTYKKYYLTYTSKEEAKQIFNRLISFGIVPISLKNFSFQFYLNSDKEYLFNNASFLEYETCQFLFY